jgi:hypothetical protein
MPFILRAEQLNASPLKTATIAKALLPDYASDGK